VSTAGHDGILNEHIIHGGNSLAVHTCLLFNSFIRNAFVPTAFQKGIIKPLLKHKHGDASKLEMYRGITLPPILSRLFESVLVTLYEDFLTSDSLQFGF